MLLRLAPRHYAKDSMEKFQRIHITKQKWVKERLTLSIAGNSLTHGVYLFLFQDSRLLTCVVPM